MTVLQTAETIMKKGATSLNFVDKIQYLLLMLCFLESHSNFENNLESDLFICFFYVGIFNNE